MLIQQLLNNEALMIEMAGAIINHMIDHNMLLCDFIPWLWNLNVAPEIMLPLLHNTHRKQYMLFYPFGFCQYDIVLRLEHAEITIVPSHYASFQIVNGYAYFSFHMNTTLYEEFRDMLAIESMRLLMLLFNSRFTICSALGIDDPDFVETSAENIQKKIILYKK